MQEVSLKKKTNKKTPKNKKDKNSTRIEKEDTNEHYSQMSDALCPSLKDRKNLGGISDKGKKQRWKQLEEGRILFLSFLKTDTGLCFLPSACI